ncbi:serine hydrolase domain-containing protein [Dactylosporangium sucinum]|uniref:Serine hydrolase n=1 Tax=Dactylosporangium sucinum TaxID=1424081 RepID=A0A917TU53_9ACTN|nr:serine hydrolase domain-containing protein [Dactylosporangium sucinum]GGM36368.1 serine hydrolase [Dactylosporangium sucinum]
MRADSRAAAPVAGHVEPGFEPVRDAFAAAFTDDGELGAAFAAYRDGEPVVDLWGGVADARTGAPWRPDTMQLIFSGTKGLVAVCLLLLVDRGRLRLDRPVAAYWPEFAAAGKGGVLVRDVVAHTARLPGLTTPVTWREATDATRMAALVAAQPQSNDRRAADTYHTLTFGWLCGELLRRIDGRTVGRFFAEEVAGPLGIEAWIGLPAALEPRVARLELDLHAPGPPEHDAFARSVLANPVRRERLGFPGNERAWHAAEVPAANGIATARAVALLYGRLDRLVGAATLDLARRPLSVRVDPLHGGAMAFGVGFQVQTEAQPFGPPPDAFGHGGFGGSLHGRWPGSRVGFSYATNLLRDDPGDRRAARVLAALHDCLADGPR